MKSVCKQISDLEGEVFYVDGTHVSLKCSANDIKIAALLPGELQNSAKYFSTFANVSKANCKEFSGTFVTGIDNTREPWEYKAGLKVVKKVKLSLAEKTMSEKLRRRRSQSSLHARTVHKGLHP